MGVVVFDSDVLIAFLSASDANHEDAVARVRESLAPGTRRVISAVNYSEILVGPLRVGTQGRVEEMLVKLGIETITVDTALAERAAAVRARTDLKLPDAYALATAMHMETRGWEDVEIASFDKRVLRERANLST